MTFSDDLEFDLSHTFFSPANSEFQDTATYTQKDGPSVSVTGIYDDQADQQDGDFHIEGQQSQPTFRCAKSSVPYAKRGDVLFVRGLHHEVAEPRDEGDGTITLLLEKQQ